MCCTDFFAANSVILSGRSCFRTLSIKAFRFTDFFCASSTMEAPTVRMRALCIMKYSVSPKLLSLPELRGLSLLGGGTLSMKPRETSFLVARKRRSKSKWVEPPHCEQLLAAKSGSVKGPSKQVDIFNAAISIGSKDSMLQTVPPTIAVWFQAAISIFSNAPMRVAELPGFTLRTFSSLSWSSVSRMYRGLPIVTWETNRRNGGGTASSGMPK
mmetsp:Transcript_18448/g.43157  ORF Transcript_18448/g.43157 Transcript_18448/m.43157 type:complete len:213 (-) Transcript_18448:2672-3310(-)